MNETVPKQKGQRMNAVPAIDPAVSDYKEHASRLRKAIVQLVWVYPLLAVAFNWFYADTLPPGGALLIYFSAAAFSGVCVESWLSRSEAREMQAHNLLKLHALADEIDTTKRMIAELPRRLRE